MPHYRVEVLRRYTQVAHVEVRAEDEDHAAEQVLDRVPYAIGFEHMDDDEVLTVTRIKPDDGDAAYDAYRDRLMEEQDES